MAPRHKKEQIKESPQATHTWTLDVKGNLTPKL